LSPAERRARRAQAKAVKRAVKHAEAAGLEPITPGDLRVISLALEDREAKYAGRPAGVAAARVRAKVARNIVR
jgi:hypothetical protein